MAGLYARTDATRGVWKAPAGIEAALRNIQELDYKLIDPENGVLNPLGINCLRAFPVYGNVSWGARTLDGSDRQASEWKYVPVRRVALFIEESLYRGTQPRAIITSNLTTGSIHTGLYGPGALALAHNLILP
jgi:phage tail sheath protein FI